MTETSGGLPPIPLVPQYQFKTMTYLRQGWRLLLRNLGGLLGFTVAALFLNLALAAVRGLGQIFTFVINPPLWAGLVGVALKILRQQAVEANDYLLGFRFIIPLVIYTVVATIFIWVGIVLLIAPGIYLLVGYLFTTWLIVDRRLDFWPAMELSRRTIHQHWFEVFGFVILLFLLNLAGALLIGLGLIVTIPWSVCAITVAYEDVFGETAPAPAEIQTP